MLSLSGSSGLDKVAAAAWTNLGSAGCLFCRESSPRRDEEGITRQGGADGVEHAG